VLNSPARYKVLNAGRRWGKTMIGAKWLLSGLRSQDNQLGWWVAPTYKIVKRGYREVKRQTPRELLTHDFPPETHFDAGRSIILNFKNGSTMEFYSAERPSGMLGEGVDYAVVDEAAIMPSTVWEQVIRPTQMDTGGKALLISTPRGRNWFYKRWLAGQDADNAAWASWTFPSSTNPYLPDEEIEEMREELPTVLFEQEVLALFVAAGSNVFRWDVTQRGRIIPSGTSAGLVEGVAPSGHVFLGVDLAKTEDYTVLYGAQDSDLRNVYYERFNDISWPEQKRRIERATKTLESLPGVDGVTLVMDEGGVGSPIVDDMQEAGHDVVGINFTSTKAKMVSMLGKDLEAGRAVLLEEARLEEFEIYEMNATPKGVLQFSAPPGDHDDVVSAKMLSHWGMTSFGAPSVETIGGDDIAEEAHAPAQGDPWDEPAGDDFSDLVDEPPGASAAEIAHKMYRVPSTSELLNNRDLWG